MYDKEPLLEIRPYYLYWPAFFTRIPMTIFFTIWGAGFCGGFSLAGVMSLQKIGFPFAKLIPMWFPFVFFGLVFFLGTQFWSLIAEQKAYEKTRYLFFEDEIICHEGFWHTQEKAVRYKNIVEISHIKGFFQQKFGLGTIKFTTAGHGGSGEGVEIKDIPDSENVYRFIKEHLNRIREEAKA